MNVVTLPPALFARARFNVQRERYRAWRHQVEKFQTVAGARATLVHVPEEVWRARFAANDWAFDAVVEQMEAFDD